MKKILVIEDEAETRNNLVLMLGMEGFHALSAPNGRVGVNIAKRELPEPQRRRDESHRSTVPPEITRGAAGTTAMTLSHAVSAMSGAFGHPLDVVFQGGWVDGNGEIGGSFLYAAERAAIAPLPDLGMPVRERKAAGIAVI